MANQYCKQSKLYDIPVALPDIQSIKNGLIKISHDIEKESPYFSQELFEMKDRMFVGYGTINPVVFGQVIEILKSLQQADNTKGMGVWDLIHPKIVAVSQKLFEDGHYANAAEDAFVEINDRVKTVHEGKSHCIQNSRWSYCDEHGIL